MRRNRAAVGIAVLVLASGALAGAPLAPAPVAPAPVAPAPVAPPALLAPAPLAPVAPIAPVAPRILRLSLLGHAIGTERSTFERSGEVNVLHSRFEYTDRGTPVTLDATLTYRDDFTPVSYEAHGKSYRYFGVDVSVKDVPADGHTFTIEGMAPLAVQGVLIQYWLAHGRPATIKAFPSGDLIRIREGNGPPPAPGDPFRFFHIDGIIWGEEFVVLDATDLRVLLADSSAGVLPFEAWDSSRSESAAWALFAMFRPLEHSDTTLPARANGTFALTDARVLDGTGSSPVERATVLVRDGRIARVGRAVPIPSGVVTINVAGKTVMPGLWDMHAHVGQPEWGVVYLASGVTTIRDMGGEFGILTQLRNGWDFRLRQRSNALEGTTTSRLLGPRLLLAGLVDGPGPAAFGQVTASTPDEGRAAVARYHSYDFQQMKLYSLLDKPTVKAIIDAAHADGMTVTGHIPNGMTLRELIEMGADHVAHLVVRDAPGSPELRDTIAFLKAHGTVMDPTVSWNELLGRSPQTPIASFQPGIERVAPPLRRLLEGANGGNVTPEQARERLSRQLAIIKALHDAGIPIVAGTDKGVPGFSVQREIELYVQAGITPMDAIRAATAVPARVMGLEKDSGTIESGRRADLIVVDGNPLERISDIRNVTMVCVNGRLFDTAPLWKAAGYR